MSVPPAAGREVREQTPPPGASRCRIFGLFARHQLAAQIVKRCKPGRPLDVHDTCFLDTDGAVAGHIGDHLAFEPPAAAEGEGDNDE